MKTEKFCGSKLLIDFLFANQIFKVHCSHFLMMSTNTKNKKTKQLSLSSDHGGNHRFVKLVILFFDQIAI
jgi:hypothetical protein